MAGTNFKGPLKVSGNTVIGTDGKVSANAVNSTSLTGNSVGTAALAVNTIQTTQVALSSAQILALSATPITLVAAQGAGTVVEIVSIIFKMVTTATQYANGGALEFRYTDGSGAKVTADVAAAVVTAGAGTSYTNVKGVVTSLTMVANAPVVVTNATAAFITGTGTANVTVVYRVVTA